MLIAREDNKAKARVFAGKVESRTREVTAIGFAAACAADSPCEAADLAPFFSVTSSLAGLADDGLSVECCGVPSGCEGGEV